MDMVPPGPGARAKGCGLKATGASGAKLGRTPDWKDPVLLRVFLHKVARNKKTKQWFWIWLGRITPRRYNGNCPKHQRLLATAIANAREMALLPYE